MLAVVAVAAAATAAVTVRCEREGGGEELVYKVGGGVG